MQHTIVYHPDYADANPYQSLLYSSLDPIFHSQSGAIDFARRQLDSQAWDNRIIFHLHWEDAIYRHLPSEAQALDECRRFLHQLERFVDDGGLFLWTVHNGAPHDRRHLDVHRQLCAKLAVLADQIHLHSYAALQELARERTLDCSKVTVIPHGNYRPIFPDPPAVGASRADGGRCFLLFGRLGRYKGGAELVRAFAALDAPAARLMIAGKQIDPIDLACSRANRRRIQVSNHFLSDRELLEAFGAADFVVSPYLASLTSGTILLAMSLARPVIAPHLPTMVEFVVDGDNGYLFDPDDPNGLVESLRRANAIADDDWRRMSERAFATASRYDWRVIGHLFSGLLHRLINTTLRARRAKGDPSA